MTNVSNIKQLTWVEVRVIYDAELDEGGFGAL